MTHGEQPERGMRLARVRTGITGLDEVLAGGLVQGGIYLVEGRPGSGKTTFGNHLAFNHARDGGTALFLTTMAESHGRMLAHLGGFDFFNPELIARRVQYLSVYDSLRENGLAGLLGEVRRLVREHHASLLVLDGTAPLAQHSASGLEYARFIVDLHAMLSTLGCTALLLADHDIEGTLPIATHVDGILTLRDQVVGLRRVRLLEVVKARGVPCLRGEHQFAITDAGIEVYPRLEALIAADPPTPPARSERLGFGVPGLDAMLHGGLLAGSTTLLLGTPGAGKTIAGLHFVAEGARRSQPGLIASFHESPAHLLQKAEAVGLELAHYTTSGLVRILWRPPVEVLLDAWGHELLMATAEQRSARLLIDGLTDLVQLAAFPERLPAYLTALTNKLRQRQITTLLTAEVPTVVGTPPDLPSPAGSATVENLLLLRYVELRSRLRRLVSVVKTRASAHDTAIREFVLSERGMQVAATFESAEAILTGIAHVSPTFDLPVEGPAES